MKDVADVASGADVASLPLRECGLKDLESDTYHKDLVVTPLAGVWIESF